MSWGVREVHYWECQACNRPYPNYQEAQKCSNRHLSDNTANTVYESSKRWDVV